MTRDDRLADLLVAWDDAHASGRVVTPQDHCCDHPDLLDPFVRLLRQLGHINRVFDAPPADPCEDVEQIDAGRFKPVAFHAAGGLGVVAVAEDQELNRTVALKVMQRLAALDPAARRRFQYEAEVTGKLEHPGVAPVYGAGEDPSGRPYYAMRFIRGNTLADAVRDYHASPADPTARRLEFTRLLRCFASVCQTVAYAHARGVLHRDIKPGNIMLGRYGETLLVDWGLAREMWSAERGMPSDDSVFTAADSSIPHSALRTPYFGDDPTRTGVAKGTPAYMAPEQARGDWDRVGPAADVYALGATLYAVLAGRSPYTGATAEAVMRAVKVGPPQAVGQVNPSTSKPLVAVCAKAMARTPAERYASAQELAADVERWLADEPVTAYRDPLFTRVRRWVKRNRTPAAAAAAAVLVVAVALAVVVPLLAAKNRELTQQKEALEKAYGELEQSHAARRTDFSDADAGLRAVIDSVFARAAVAEDPLTRRFRRQALDKYREYLSAFTARNAERADVRLEVALAWLKVGEVDAMVGRTDEAVAAFAEAERRFAVLKAESPTDRDVQFGWACAILQRAGTLNLKGRFGEARPLLVAARDTFTTLARDPTPLRITGYTSVEGVLEDSPRMRLVEATLELARVQEKADTAKRVGTLLPTYGKTYRTGLTAALDALNGGKPLPPNAPVMSKLREFGLRLELAATDSGPVATDDLQRLLADLDPLVMEYPLLVELQHLQYGAKRLLLQSEMASLPAHTVWARLFELEILAEKLIKSDHGVDHLGLKDDAELAHAEVRCDMAEYPHENFPAAAKRRLEQATMTLSELAARERLMPDTRLRAILLCVRVGMLGSLERDHRAVAEKAYETGIKLVGPLRAANADNVDLLPIELMLNLGWAGMRAGQQLPLGQPAADARAQLEAIRKAGPDDDLIAFSDIMLATFEARELALEAKKPAEAEERIRFAQQRLTDGEKLGIPMPLVDGQRLSLDVMQAWFLVLQAEAHLTASPPDPTAAVRQYDEALRMIRDRLAKPIRSDPLHDEKFKLLNAYTRDRANWVAEMIEGLRAAAEKKK